MAAFIIYIIRWAVCLTLFYSLFGLFLKRETLHGMNRIVLLAILVASMVLPLCQIETGRKNIVTQSREKIEYQIANVQNPLSDDIKRITITNPDNGVKYTHIPIRDDVNAYILIAIAIYLTGLATVWGRYFWQLTALLLLMRRSKRVEVEGLPKGVRALVHPDIKTPCSWMRWMLLNPADTNVRPIIKHELAHIRLGHSWDMLLCEFCCRMLWFVPFVWMLRQDLRDVHEYQADRRVLQGGIKDEEYQLLLIKKATSTGLQPVVNAFNQSPIKRRFKMMYRKPSRRWVALKAAYLLPLSALAVVAFARPQAISEIEEKVETEVTKYVATATWNNDAPAEAEQATPTVLPAVVETTDSVQVMTDANLVKADLADARYDVLSVASAKSATELLDSTMQAVGARKIAEGTYIGHFQPSLNSDTVRIARATILDRKSQQTDEHLFAQNTADPYAYNVTLNAETRKDRTGYYIRYLQPTNSTVRNYDKKEVDPMMLSTDSVLTKRSFRPIYTYTPAAIERNKKDTRVYMYVGFRGEAPVDTWRQQNINHYSDYAIVDELTGDKYVCRATDYDYFKYVNDETITYVKDGKSHKDTIRIYQTCLVFPPLGKNVKEAYFGPVKDEGRYSNTFDVNKIPRKGRVITK
ncbi:MAG: M56 family metallopeptidase [Prevotella sp.]|nr:M56 family metallopeptidase [Prevotella sp.]